MAQAVPRDGLQHYGFRERDRLFHHVAAHVAFRIGDHALHHFAADRTGFPGGDIPIVTLLQVYVQGASHLGLQGLKLGLVAAGADPPYGAAGPA